MFSSTKFFRILSISIILITVLCLFSFSVAYVAKGGKRLGPLTEPINTFASFPETAMTVLTSTELKGVPPTYHPHDPAFEQKNELAYDLYGLNAFYNTDQESWDVRLFNFFDDSTHYTWTLDKSVFHQGERQFENAEPRNCVALPDTSLILGSDESYNLFRLDKNSNVIWHQTNLLIHHSLNQDENGDIWVCTRTSRGIKDYQQKVRAYLDDHITKVSSQTGEVLFDRSLSDILIANGYHNFVYGASNHIGFSDADIDPLHLNDIEPATSDGKYWKKGDVFISLRNKSLVFLYRPEKDSIVNMIFGPFLNQHDVDIISDDEISIFNNNLGEVGTQDGKEIETELGNLEKLDESLRNSNIIIYNFEDQAFRTHLEEHFKEENIFTRTQGFHEHLSNGDVYVESQNDGKMYVMNREGVLLKKTFETPISEMVERPHWIRIFEHKIF